VDALDGRTAVVTGAASGIGLAMARRFAAEQMAVVMARCFAADLNEFSNVTHDGSAAPIDARATAITRGGRPEPPPVF
jgi:NAD(P)-dependent dehydrogenase (short-subunit alcohol dehydrogenase family)